MEHSAGVQPFRAICPYFSAVYDSGCMTAAVIQETFGSSLSRWRYQRIVRAVLAGLLGKGTNLLVSLLLVPVTLRYLGVERYGLWTTIAGSVNLYVLLDVGIANTLTNLIAESHADGDRRHTAEFFSSALWLTCGVSVLLGAVVFFAWPYLDWAAFFHVRGYGLERDTGQSAAVAVAILLVSLPAGLAPRVCAGFQELHVAGYFAAAGSLLSLVAVLFGIAWHAGLPFLVGAYAGAIVLCNLACLAWLTVFQKPWMVPWPRLLRVTHVRRILSTSYRFFAIQIAGLIVMNSDNLVLSHFLSPAAVTPYNTTWRLVGYVSALQGLPIAAMWPAIAEANHRRDMAWIRTAYRRMRCTTLGVLACACAVLLPFGKVILRIWAGPAAVPSTALLVLMCVWMCLSAITVYQANLMGAVNRVGWQAIYSGIAAAVNLVLSLWWVRTLGQVGVLLATVVSYVVFLVGPQLYVVRRILRFVPAAGEAHA